MFIKSATAISPQNSLNPHFNKSKIEVYNGNKYVAKEPDYKDMIPKAMLRRMNKAVRMGVAAGLMSLKNQPIPDAIILGTALGGIDDSFKFLRQIIEYDEGILTPTNFVQSTPNSVAGILALMANNTNYNLTHVNDGFAFEGSLLDAFMLFEEKKAKQILIGSFDEISQHNFNIEIQGNWYKTEPITSNELLHSKTTGSVIGEGSAMFQMGSDPVDALAQVLSVNQLNSASEEDVILKIRSIMDRFQIENNDISLLVGRDGDTRHDQVYDSVTQNLFAHQPVYTFKNLIGDYPTASSFALWLSTIILKCKSVPKEIIWQGNHTIPKFLLIYNHFRLKQFSLILVKRV